MKNTVKERTKRVISSDRFLAGKAYMCVLTKDAEKLLQDYFVLSETPRISVTEKEGGYEVLISVRANRIKNTAKIPD